MKQEKNLAKGLTSQEVDKAIAAHQTNEFQERYAKSTADIFRDNLLTPFNFIIALIAAALISVGSYINMLFIIVIIINIVVGIIQELIAKRLVTKLSLLSANKVQVVRDQKFHEIKTSKIVLNDLMHLEANQQISCDSVIIEGEIEVNEAMLTGEYDPIIKKKNEQLLSGSHIVSGACYARVENVGADNFAKKISIEAKKHKKTHSVLLSSLNKALKLSTLIIIPVGIALFVRTILSNASLHDAVITTSAALISMIPIGLVLLITASLATGVIKLARLNILVQELYALESLSRVNMLCLDKTGTLTQGAMRLTNVSILADEISIEDINTIMKKLVGCSQENNSTFLALKSYFGASTCSNIYAQSHFSSERKYSSVSFMKKETFFLGAADVLLKENIPEAITYALAKGKRLILLGKQTNENPIQPLAFFELDDPIRENASETIGYFKKQGVAIRIISGDNPLAVAKIAQQVNVENADKYLDLTNIDDDKLQRVAQEYTIFGRANPHQKKLLIQAFKKHEYTVAMTGDGINDVLALKEASCSIAMAQGSDAAKSVSQLVLLDSDFTNLPRVVHEGRHVVNNITRVASIYFVKTIYSALLALLSILWATKYPFSPIQITLINIAIVGLPTFFMTFEKNTEKISQDFLSTTFLRALPNALSIIIAIIIIKCLGIFNLVNPSQQMTLMYFVVAFVTFMTIVQASQPINNYRKTILLVSTGCFFALLLFFQKVINLAVINVQLVIFLLVILVICLALMKGLRVLTANYLQRKHY